MKTINDESIDMVFADPPYNIKKADWDDFGSQERYIEWSMRWIEQASRILKPTGSLYVCGFSEILADLKHPSMRYFSSCRWLVWFYRNKANLGKDWGRSHESILHLRKKDFGHINYDDVRIPYGKHTLKYPDHPQADSSQYGRKGSHWTPNPLGAKPKDVIEIPTTCNGMNEKTPHPTQKPEELLRKLILASSSEGALVLDPSPVPARQPWWLRSFTANGWPVTKTRSTTNGPRKGLIPSTMRGPSNSGWPLTETITKEEDQSDDHDIEPTGGMGQRQGTVHHGC